MRSAGVLCFAGLLLGVAAVACANGGASDVAGANGADGGGTSMPTSTGDADASQNDDGAGPTPTPGTSIYVSTAGADTNDGMTPETAFRSIPAGIAQATQCLPSPCIVVVAAGTYTGQVELKPGVNVFGGYSADFSSRDVAADVVTITATDPRTVVADGVTALTTLDGVTIAGANLTTPAGASTYGLWVNNSSNFVYIGHAIINAGQGAPGAAGAAGTARTCTATGGLGGVATDCSSATGGSGTAGGDPVQGGGGGGGGSSDCPDACPLVSDEGVSSGSTGATGGNGTNGTGGMPSSDAFGTFMG
jgi:hypothetical protein